MKILLAYRFLLGVRIFFKRDVSDFFKFHLAVLVACPQLNSLWPSNLNNTLYLNIVVIEFVHLICVTQKFSLRRKVYETYPLPSCIQKKNKNDKIIVVAERQFKLMFVTDEVIRFSRALRPKKTDKIEVDAVLYALLLLITILPFEIKYKRLSFKLPLISVLTFEGKKIRDFPYFDAFGPPEFRNKKLTRNIFLGEFFARLIR